MSSFLFDDTVWRYDGFAYHRSNVSYVKIWKYEAHEKWRNIWSKSLIINNDPSWHIKVLTKWIDTACQRQCITYAHRLHTIDMVSVLVPSRLNRTNRVLPGILIPRPLSANFLSAQELLYHKLKNCAISILFLIGTLSYWRYIGDPTW